MTSTSFPLTLVACSAPEGWDKRKLLPPKMRARALLWKIGRLSRRQVGRGNRRHVAAGLFESGTRMDVAAARAGWAFQLSDPPNNRMKDGTVRGNGLLWLHVPGLQLDHTLTVDVGRRNLHLPVYQSEQLGLRIFVGHRETQKADPDGKGRRAVEATLEAAVAKSMKLGWHVVVMVDWNGGWFDRHGPLDVAARHKVDWIFVSPGIEVDDVDVVKGGLVTDHPRILVAQVRIPLTSGPAIAWQPA